MVPFQKLKSDGSQEAIAHDETQESDMSQDEGDKFL